jgi:hypothetical protein
MLILFITAINFPNSNPYTISGANILTLQGVNSGDPSFINITKGHHAIASDMDSNNNTVLTVTASPAVSSQSAQSLRSTIGAWINYLWEWIASLPSSSMRTVGARRNTYLGGLDCLFTLYKKYGIEASYDFEQNNLFHDHSIYLGFSFEF